MTRDILVFLYSYLKDVKFEEYGSEYEDPYGQNLSLEQECWLNFIFILMTLDDIYYNIFFSHKEDTKLDCSLANEFGHSKYENLLKHFMKAQNLTDHPLLNLLYKCKIFFKKKEYYSQ